VKRVLGGDDLVREPLVLGELAHHLEDERDVVRARRFDRDRTHDAATMSARSALAGAGLAALAAGSLLLGAVAAAARAAALAAAAAAAAVRVLPAALRGAL